MRQWAEEVRSSDDEPISQRVLDAVPDFIHRTRGDEVYKVGCNVTLLVVHILVLSLIDTNLDALRLCFDRSWHESLAYGDCLPKLLFDALQWHTPKSYLAHDVVKHVLRTVSHGRPRADDSWLTTSRRGQVLLPRLLFEMKLEDEPCFRFLCVPGVLSLRERPKGEVFEMLTSSERVIKDRLKESPTAVPSSQVKTLSAFGSLQHDWLYRILADSVQVHLSFKGHAEPSGRVDPRNIFYASDQLFFIPPCRHSHPNLIKSERIEDYIFIHPNELLEDWMEDSSEVKIRVYAVRGNEALRLMILGNLYNKSESIGFSRNACLKCSLEACRKEGLRYLIC